MRLARNSLAIACALALAAPIFAQTVPDLPPPERVRVDENGVDLARGTFTGTRTDVAIGGEGRSGLALVRRFGYTVNVSSWDLGLFVQGSTTTASLRLTSVPFTQSASTYTAADGSGATLVKNGSAWVLTTGDGTVVTYDYLTHDTGDFNRKARATSILYPSGERITLTWAATSYCTNFSDNCQTGTWIDAVRLQAVSTSMGYQLHYNYARDNQPIGTNQGQAWRRLEQVVAINTTVEPWDPAAGPCTLANSRPTVSVSGNHGTDPEQRTSSYVVDPSAQTFSIRRPSAASPNLVY